MEHTDAPASCTEPATVIFEVYSSTRGGGLHGSLDLTVYCCAEHREGYRLAILGAGLTPFQAGRPGITRVCGQVWDFDRMDVTTWAEWSA